MNVRVIICIRTCTRKIDSISLCDLIGPSTRRLISIVVSYSLRTANVSTRSSPLSGQRWARRNVCRSQATRFRVSFLSTRFRLKQWKRNNTIYRNSEYLQSYAKQQFVTRDQILSLPVVYCRYYFNQNSSFTPDSSIRVSLHSFYQFISYVEK